MGFGVSQASGSGVEVYGAAKPEGIGGWIERAFDSAELQWNAMAGIAQTSEWQLLTVAVPLLALAVFIYRREVPWLALGLLAAGWTVLIFQGVVLLPEPRYLIPGIALFAMAAVLLLAELPPWVRGVAIALVVLLAVVKADDAKTAMDGWAAIQVDDNEKGIQAVADLNPQRCRVYTNFLTYEMGESVPRLVALREPDADRPCDPRFAGVIAGLETDPSGPLASDDSALRACADRGGPTVLLRTPGVSGQPPWVIAGCKRFRKQLDGRPVADVLLQSRLAPGVGTIEARKRCEKEFGAPRCASPLASPQEYFGSR
jgi:hypothetical protein